MPNHPQTIVIDSFKGLNNVLSPESTSQDYLKEVDNINIDKSGRLSKRKGYELNDSGNYSCIWSNDTDTVCYAVKDGDLIQILSDLSSVTIRANVGDVEISFEEVNSVIYYTSKSVNGIIENGINRSWGLETPSTLPVLSIGFGGLAAGDYQVSYTYINSEGKESGANLASIISVDNNSSIIVGLADPLDPDIVSYRIYCSMLNGSVLYFYNEVLIGSPVSITNVSSLSSPLKTFNFSPPPLGDIVKYYKGRLYIAQDNYLWYSEPHQYEYFQLDSNYLDLPDRIIELMPVEDGIWVGADHVYYISGTEVDNHKLSLKERIKVVKGTSSYLSGSYILLDNMPIGYKWLITTDLGIFVLFNQGVIINLTATNLSLDRAVSGTSVFLQDGGMNQYLSILNKSDETNNSVIGDVVTTSIIRNGITIS